jgi:peptidyl-prolyl cis-trans isomerase C
MTVNTRLLAFVAVAALGAAVGTTAYMTRANAEDSKIAATNTAAGTADKTPLKKAIKPGVVYATINDEKLTGKDVQAFVSKLQPQMQDAPAAQLLEMIVNQMVNDRLVAIDAEKKKLADEAVTKQRIAEITEQVIRDRYVEKALEGKVTDKDVKAKYAEIIKSIPDQNEIRASHILVKDEKTANEVLEKLKKGDDFAKLAKEYSTDLTKEKGGDLGYFVKGAMVPEFGEAAFTLKKGEVSKTAIKTQFGYHIIKVVDSRKHVKPTLEQIQDRIRAQLTDEQIRKMVDDLRTKSKVEITLPKA